MLFQLCDLDWPDYRKIIQCGSFRLHLEPQILWKLLQPMLVIAAPLQAMISPKATSTELRSPHYTGMETCNFHTCALTVAAMHTVIWVPLRQTCWNLITVRWMKSHRWPAPNMDGRSDPPPETCHQWPVDTCYCWPTIRALPRDTSVQR